MHLATSSCNPAKHKSSTMVKNFLSRSWGNACRSPACSCANTFCHNPAQTRIAGASQQIDDDPLYSEPLKFERFFCEAELWLQSRILPTYLPKVLWTPEFSTISMCKSSSRDNTVHFLPISSSKSTPRTQFLIVFKCKSSSWYSPVPVLSTTAETATL